MPARTPLTKEQIDQVLAELDGWRHEDDRLKRTFTLRDFRAAVGFIVRMAFCAEALNHHPELFNVYNRVEVALSTHDAGGRVTETDVELARAIAALPQA